MRENAQGGPQLPGQHSFSRYEATHKEALCEPWIHNYTACSRCVKAFPRPTPRATMKAHPSQPNRPIDSNMLHYRLIRRGETNRPPSVILRCAQDDKQVLPIAAAFWSPFLGLLNE